MKFLRFKFGIKKKEETEDQNGRNGHTYGKRNIESYL